MIEQLSLFTEQKTPSKPAVTNALVGTWWKPKDFYRYNENGRPSGWVRITSDYVARIDWDELKHKIYASYYRNKESSHWWWITEGDLKKYFEQIPKPGWKYDD